MDLSGIIDAASQRLRPLCGENCRIGLILGSGLGAYAEGLDRARVLDYTDIPGYPRSSVLGHKGRFVVGERFGKTVLAMQGRFHYYEGYPQSVLTIGVRTMKRLGITHLLLTNAAGGVNLDFSAGDLMLITDHINYSGQNPLIGPNDDAYGVRFPDASNVYDRALRNRLLPLAEQNGIALQQGVYMMFSGPSFETPAEIRMARILGASAVGMSTVPEAIAAAHCGIRTLGVSLITNMAAGVLDQPLTHEEVQQAANAASQRFSTLVDLIVRDVF